MGNTVMKHNRFNQRGIGMIEILVSLVILAVGLLSVATLHVNIINQSHESKARSEAIAIAESRFETMRNFGSAMKNIVDFNEAFTEVTAGNSTPIPGTNAAFTRTETITDRNDAKEISVYVKWTDINDDAQEVVVNSSIAWVSSRSSGDVIDPLGAPLIPSATGRARLGDGTMETGSPTVSTGDGMSLYDREDGE